MNDFEKLKQEFQEFSYIVSHDFLASLRHIKYFSRIFIDKFEDRFDLSDEEIEFKDYLYKSISKLELMTSSLKSYAQTTSSELSLERCNPRQLLDECLATLPAEKTNRIKVEDMPFVHADKTQLMAVFLYILDNSLKYSAPPFVKEADAQALPVVVAGKIVDEGVEISFYDFGIGIEDQSKSHVFQMFRQLHPDKENNDIGTGLTLSKKIIERHGGRIWIEDLNEEMQTYCASDKKGEGCAIKLLLPRG